MPSQSFEPFSPRLLRHQDFSHLLHVLQKLGYRVLGPVLSNGAIKWDQITRVEDLPIGWKDQQRPGSYRLEPDSSGRYFNIVHGPQSLKPLVFAPRETLLVLDRNGKTFSAKETVPEIPPTAVLGSEVLRSRRTRHSRSDFSSRSASRFLLSTTSGKPLPYRR